MVVAVQRGGARGAQAVREELPAEAEPAVQRLHHWLQRLQRLLHHWGGHVAGGHLQRLQHAAPAAAQAVRVRGDGLRDALHRELAHHGRIARAQDAAEGAQRLLLVREVRQLRAHQQLAHQLPQAVHRVHGHLEVLVARGAHNVRRERGPDARPHKPDAAQVVVRALHQLLQHVHARAVFQLLLADGAHRAHKHHHRLAVHLGAAGKHALHLRAALALRPRHVARARALPHHARPARGRVRLGALSDLPIHRARGADGAHWRGVAVPLRLHFLCGPACPTHPAEHSAKS
mmetsp:Transcript_1470/g.3790  ORF Transcript_1470/g.3790 Transcript_1470/m.3790 type:complete len:289 (+) Transcript_1470:1132-1998(+)